MNAIGTFEELYKDKSKVSSDCNFAGAQSQPIEIKMLHAETARGAGFNILRLIIADCVNILETLYCRCAHQHY